MSHFNFQCNQIPSTVIQAINIHTFPFAYQKPRILMLLKQDPTDIVSVPFTDGISVGFSFDAVLSKHFVSHCFHSHLISLLRCCFYLEVSELV